MNKPPSVLVAPLDWGLGHATRCVPVVHALLDAGAEVKLAGTGKSLQLLAGYFPALEVRELPGYDVRFKSLWSLLPQFPGIFSTIQKEKRILGTWVKEGWVDAVISDNRYGLHHPDLPTVMMCHQLAPIPPFGGSIAHTISFRLHSHYLSKFDEVWIPDVQGSLNLAGELCHTFEYSGRLRWLGPLSRFDFIEKNTKNASYDIVILVSGPEPQRSLLEQALISKTKHLKQSVLLIQGKPDQAYERTEENLSIVNFMDGPALASTLQNAQCVLARPGYSSLMDFASLGLEKLILIPTPGQTEQQYLASRLHRKGLIWQEKQDSINLDRALQEVGGCKGLGTMSAHGDLLAQEIASFIAK